MSELGIDQRVFHGDISPGEIAEGLMAEFDQGGYQARMFGSGDNLVVQIATDDYRRSGGETAVSVHLNRIEDGVLVKMGEQSWLGIAASMGKSALMALVKPRFLFGRIDDIAQDIQSLQIVDRIWANIDRSAAAAGASRQISDRLRRLSCEYCQSANIVGAPHCVACGAPLGLSQPVSCLNCGFVSEAEVSICPSCGEAIP